jgi:hypothetical protein
MRTRVVVPLAESDDTGPKGPFHRSLSGGGLPRTYEPARGSLVDFALRRLAEDWDFQKSYNRYYVYSLPSRLRAALVKYIGRWSEIGVTVSDLKTILSPAPDEDENNDSADGDKELNHNFYCLDLSGSVGRSISMKDLLDLLFPTRQHQTLGHVQDSWDAAEPASVPAQLLPGLTHLSLAIDPNDRSKASWRHLLSLSSQLPTLTHLSLAYWPEPSLTPNAKFSSVISQQGLAIQYGGTGPYSHSIDEDWYEAIATLRKLSRNLYGLEYLDLTGCQDWWRALRREENNVSIDWAAQWGKINTLVLLRGGPDRPACLQEDAVTALDAAHAIAIERHIISQRAGKGRFITVHRDEVRRSAH